MLTYFFRRSGSKMMMKTLSLVKMTLITPPRARARTRPHPSPRPPLLERMVRKRERLVSYSSFFHSILTLISLFRGLAEKSMSLGQRPPPLPSLTKPRVTRKPGVTLPHWASTSNNI